MFTLDQVVPWGRSFDEYVRMFALSDEDLQGRILGGADGPASFNAEGTRRGCRIVSCDPLYRWNAAEIRGRIAATANQVLEETRRHAHEFVWDTIRSVDELGEIRMAAMDAFLQDYESAMHGGRYIAAELPALPFGSESFDLALCSHFLFLYSSQLGEAFHHAAICELCRVAAEVRIFPLLAIGARASPYVDSSVALLRHEGYDVTIDTVPYEFQRGGNRMMRVRRNPLLVSVESYAGYRGEETPVRFSLGARRIEVDEVADRWLAPDHRYFKVRTAEGIYILRNDAVSGVWELTSFRRVPDARADVR
jgi:hypothetical protein